MYVIFIFTFWPIERNIVKSLCYEGYHSLGELPNFTFALCQLWHLGESIFLEPCLWGNFVFPDEGAWPWACWQRSDHWSSRSCPFEVYEGLLESYKCLVGSTKEFRAIHVEWIWHQRWPLTHEYWGEVLRPDKAVSEVVLSYHGAACRSVKRESSEWR